MSSDEELVLARVRALLDQLQLDRGKALHMGSRLTSDLGLDSLSTVELCDQLETQFDVSLPDEVFLTNETPGDWLRSIRFAKGELSTTDESIAPENQGRVTLTPTLRSRSEPIGVVGAQVHPASSPGQWMYALYAWTLTVPFAIIIWTLALVPISTSNARRIARPIGRVYCRLLGVKVRVRGSLPTTIGSLVITPNHSSFIDGLILYIYLNEPVIFISSVELERQLIFGRILKKFGCVFVQRGRAERGAQAVAQLVDALARGGRIVIFPEGSLDAQTELQPFHLGAFETASSLDARIVPVGIRGSRLVLPPRSCRPHPGMIDVNIGTSLGSHGTTFTQRVALRDETYAAISALIDAAETH
ncbi:MAG: 1-acyl-sn-glycerol-3-phosphate acyltransferase [Acidimicrobiales bacterium]